MNDRPPPPQYPAGPPVDWPPFPPVPEPPPPVPPPNPRWIDDPQHRARLWGAVAIVFAVIVGALVGAAAADRPPSLGALAVTSSSASSDDTTASTDSSGSSDSSDSGATTTTTPPSLDTVVLDIETFVEHERGLKFKQHVDVELADDSEFQQLLLSEFDKHQAANQEDQQVLTALGLVPPRFDVVKNERSLLAIAVGGFYDPETKRLVIRAATVTPFTRQVIAHELTHALDDQWFNLNRPQLDNADDESGFGFAALVEGNARRVENAYVAAMTPADQEQAMTEQASVLAQHPELFDLPPVLLALAQAPYDDGLAFVENVLDHGGQTELDHAFISPPVTSEQIFDPARYLAGEGPANVAPPDADGTALNRGVLGARLLREMLFETLPSSAEVQRAISGWGGDEYVTWTDSAGQSCLRDTFVGDTAGDTQELVQGITEWSKDHGATVTPAADGAATFTVCA
jgi:hypothetical protein